RRTRLATRGLQDKNASLTDVPERFPAYAADAPTHAGIPTEQPSRCLRDLIHHWVFAYPPEEPQLLQQPQPPPHTPIPSGELQRLGLLSGAIPAQRSQPPQEFVQVFMYVNQPTAKPFHSRTPPSSNLVWVS